MLKNCTRNDERKSNCVTFYSTCSTKMSFKYIMWQWCNNWICSAALHLAHPSAIPCHLSQRVCIQGLHCALEALKNALHFSVEHVAFCLLLNTAAFPCKDVHHLYISMCACCVGEWSFSSFLSLSAPLPLFLFLLLFKLTRLSPSIVTCCLRAQDFLFRLKYTGMQEVPLSYPFFKAAF